MEANKGNEAKSFGKNVGKVAFSNIFSLLAGIVVGFIVPMIMGVTEYGYYKIYTLYLGYVGLFHFGFIDGIYLKYAGSNYDSLDKPKFRMFVRVLTVLELVITLVIAIFSMFWIGNEYFFIFIAVAIALFGKNMSTFFEYLSQMTGRFNQYSIRNLINSVLTIASIGVLFLLFKFTSIGFIQYKLYTIITLAIIYVLMLWYLHTYRELIFGKTSSIKENKSEIISLFKLGCPLLFANLIANFVLNMDRQFVSILFDTETYGLYAFAYSMLSLVTVAAASISTVLYPTLKSKESTETISSNYHTISVLLLVLVFGAIIGYFILVPFVEGLLPQYSGSLPVFRVLFPALGMQTAITIVMSNYYKAFDMTKKYFIVSIIILGLSFVANLIAYYAFGTTISISVASVFVMLIWYLLCEFFLIRRFHVKWKKNLFYILFLTTVFYLVTMLQSLWLSALIYIAIYCVVTLVLYRSNLKLVLKKFIK